MALTEKIPLQNKVAELEGRIADLEKWKKEYSKQSPSFSTTGTFPPEAQHHWDRMWKHFDKFFDKVFG